MCEPATALAAASFAIGAVGAISSFSGKQQDAGAQLSQQAQERYNAEVDRNYKWNQLGQRQMQEVDSAGQAVLDNSIRAVRARATAETSSAESGVQGNSVESVARDFYRQQGRIDSATIKNTEMSVDQLQEEKKSAESQYASRTNFSPVKQPSALGLGLEIAGAGIGAYDLYDRAKSRRTPSRYA